ncbi:alpha/beta fold hydrolase [Ponticoccus sp. SC2-23]|uniref:alpha/beta hydrolase n=1 Tax=Alexandriicola marinus TaxID=2081710 RepID=UPI000FD6C621|nr:alpha/beta fold hydrolase [Alexandriicola marinus]MBM1219610.1 alpha/beta fold hydrolase [Ponticoccus sp. SC6-9]MBM1223318.1 alpha/beta fold hydrolase [Ponticoccus sp. SC6-15]MBM1229423.1 alpha/beta fold hydrolase [Ponticoccus sp. SC6-38]MBM1232284.1 alpha/beta fold hydrolase [Ponticoccus sp. SC6-45]MBM1237766.1 alpha/beta fold hydrolase [Ponticoccus sp. SC6-49]MBM1241295.1 alpha/beta fold hydrolase [Ponticoccus sp. SC2-64]MBM1245808.1 alpha/beta fold hydrolase [Ponticoccus sp. SC6-42]MB
MPLPDIAHLDDWLAEREAAVPNLRPGCGKRIDWPDGKVGKAAHSVVFVHGFSAAPRELSPVPERVAAALGAPFHATRLTGHGRDGPAMAEATLEAWMRDVAEAVEIGAAIGEKVILMGCSTGCTLITLALMQGMPAAGAVMISANFALANRRMQRVMELPGAATWAPWFFGGERGFEPESEAHAANWTIRYPAIALFPMIKAVKAVRRADLSGIKVPALFATNPADAVIDPREVRRVMTRWGGPVDHYDVHPGPGEGGASGHLITGDFFSPGQTTPVIERTLRWTKERGIA